MPANRTKSRPSPRAGQKKHRTQPVLSSVTDLVLVDSQPLRQKVWRQYQTALRKHEKTVSELQQFRNSDIESYRSWYEGEFSREILALQKSRIAVAELAEWLEQVHSYAEYCSISVGKSFELLNTAKAENRLDQLWDDLAREIEETQKKGRKDFEPEFEDEFDSVFDEAARDFYQEPGPRNGSLGSTRQVQRDESAERSLKTLYHELALKLHPDTNPKQGEEEKELFQAAQEAYRDQDLETLEDLWKKLEGSAEGPFAWKTAPIGEIIQRKKSLDRRNRDATSELKFARQHPAWNFSKLAQNKSILSVLKQKTRSGLQYEQLEIDAEWLELNEVLSYLEKSAKRNSKSRTPKVKRRS